MPAVRGEAVLGTLFIRCELVSSVTDGGVNEVCDDASLEELLRELPRSLAGDGALSEPEGDSESPMLVARPMLAGPTPDFCRFGRLYDGESALFIMLKSTLMVLTPFGLFGKPVLYAVGLVFCLIAEFCACESRICSSGLQSMLSLMVTSHIRALEASLTLGPTSMFMPSRSTSSCTRKDSVSGFFRLRACMAASKNCKDEVICSSLGLSLRY